MRRGRLFAFWSIFLLLISGNIYAQFGLPPYRFESKNAAETPYSTSSNEELWSFFLEHDTEATPDVLSEILKRARNASWQFPGEIPDKFYERLAKLANSNNWRCERDAEILLKLSPPPPAHIIARLIEQLHSDATSATARKALQIIPIEYSFEPIIEAYFEMPESNERLSHHLRSLLKRGPQDTLRNKLLSELRQNQNITEWRRLQYEELLFLHPTEEVEIYVLEQIKGIHELPRIAEFEILMKSERAEQYHSSVLQAAQRVGSTICEKNPGPDHGYFDEFRFRRISAGSWESDVFRAVVAPVLEKLFDRGIPADDRVRIYWSMFSNLQTSLPFTEEEHYSLTRTFWPSLLLHHAEKDLGINSLYAALARRFSPKSKMRQEAYFIVSIFNPVVVVARGGGPHQTLARTLAENYADALLNSTSPFSFDPDILGEALLSEDSRIKALAEQMLLDRASAHTIDECLKRLDDKLPFEERFRLATSTKIMSDSAFEWSVEVFNKTRNPERIMIYQAAKTWGKSARAFLPVLLNQSEGEEYYAENKTNAVIQIAYEVGPEVFNDEGIDAAYILKRFAYSAPDDMPLHEFTEKAVVFLELGIEDEALVGAALYYLSKRLSELYDEGASEEEKMNALQEVKSKSIAALDIHVGPLVDEGFLFLFAALMKACPTWTDEIAPLRQEVLDSMY